jgi:hypothetical protein
MVWVVLLAQTSEIPVQKDVSGRPMSCFSYRQLKRILDDTFGFVLIFS